MSTSNDPVVTVVLELQLALAELGLARGRGQLEHAQLLPELERLLADLRQLAASSPTCSTAGQSDEAPTELVHEAFDDDEF